MLVIFVRARSITGIITENISYLFRKFADPTRMFSSEIQLRFSEIYVSMSSDHKCCCWYVPGGTNSGPTWTNVLISEFRQVMVLVADYALGWAGGDCPISCFFRKVSCVVLSALSVHPPDFTSRVCVCLFVCRSQGVVA